MSEYKRLTDSKTAKAMKENGNTTNPYYIYLAELEDLLEVGKLVELPCKEGDKVYQTDGIRVYDSVVKNIIFDTSGVAFDKSAIGKDIFLTRESAEARLKELEEKK